MNKQPRVVICEDSSVAGRVLNHAVNQCGYSTEAMLRTAEEAIELVKRNPPDLILMDIGLPGISGMEAARAIKAMAPNTRVILVTATSPSIQNALSNGVDGLCSKERVSSELKAAIKASEKGLCWLDLGGRAS